MCRKLVAVWAFQSSQFFTVHIVSIIEFSDLGFSDIGLADMKYVCVCVCVCVFEGMGTSIP